MKNLNDRKIPADKELHQLLAESWLLGNICCDQLGTREESERLNNPERSSMKPSFHRTEPGMFVSHIFSPLAHILALKGVIEQASLLKSRSTWRSHMWPVSGLTDYVWAMCGNKYVNFVPD